QMSYFKDGSPESPNLRELNWRNSRKSSALIHPCPSVAKEAFQLNRSRLSATNLEPAVKQAGCSLAREILAARKNLLARFAVQGNLSQRLTVGQFQTSHHKLHLRDQRRRSTEFVNAQPQQQRRQRRFPRHFTAYTHPNIVPSRRVHRRLDQSNKRRMR